MSEQAPNQDELARRRSLTFKQAEGLAPAPTQLGGHEVTRQAKIDLLALLMQVDGGQGSRELEPVWTKFFQHYADELPYFPNERRGRLKLFLESASGHDVLDFIQFLALSPILTQTTYRSLCAICVRERLPYRLQGNFGDRREPPTLFPVASAEQAIAFEKDYAQLSCAGALGSKTHLAAAAAKLSSGDFAGSVRESINAVESVAKHVSGGTNKDLAGAIKLLEQNRLLHPALKQGIEKIYAWTSDEKGVRHALLNETSNVTEDEALFMFSACAAFAAWLSKQSRPTS